MRDLYKQLNIPRNAGAKHIQYALQHCDDVLLQEDIEYILLNPARKQVYDRNRDTLRFIGSLRSRLELDDTPFWQSHEFGDFIPEISITSQTFSQGSPVKNLGILENSTVRFWIVFGVLFVLYAFIYITFF